MDSFGGMEKCPKHTKKMNFVMVLLEKATGSSCYFNGNH